MVKNSIQRLLESKYSKDFIYFSVGYMFCALLSLITTAIINKTLDRDSLGEYSYIKSLFDLVISVTSLGGKSSVSCPLKPSDSAPLC